MVHPNSNVTIESLTIYGKLPAGSFQAPLGALESSGEAAFTNVTVRNAKIDGKSDSVFINHASTCTMDLFGCELVSAYDTVRVMADTPFGSHVVNLFGCTMTAIGPFGSNRVRTVAAYRGTINLYNCVVVGRDGGSITNAGLYTDGAAGTINMYGGTLDTSNSGATPYDCQQVAGVIRVCGVRGSGADGAVTTSGTVTFGNAGFGLAALKTVDGSGSGLDTDLVRGTTPTAAGLALLDDADTVTQRTTLGIPGASSGGTVTSNSPLLDLAQTWNSAGTTFQGLKLNVTNTASASGSRLIELLNSSSTRFSIGTDGATFINNGTSGLTISPAHTFGFGGSNRCGIRDVTNAAPALLCLYGIDFGETTTRNAWMDSAGGALRISFGSAVLQQEAANVLAQRNGVNTQQLRVYNTFTSATNHEYGRFGWNSNVLEISTIKGSGGGTARDLVLGTDATERMRFKAAGAIILTGLPTSDPAVVGQLWNDTGTLKISAG